MQYYLVFISTPDSFESFFSSIGTSTWEVLFIHFNSRKYRIMYRPAAYFDEFDVLSAIKFSSYNKNNNQY